MRRASWKSRGLIIIGLVLGLALPAQAALLEDKGSFTYMDGANNTGSVNLIYDADRDITWLADANFAQTSGFDSDGRMSWSAANAWAGGLTVGFGTDWRLPTALNQNETGPCVVFNCAGSEMGHLFYDELGGNANQSVFTQGGDTVDEIANLALFSNHLQANWYWSGTEFASGSNSAWRFHFNFGSQDANSKSSSYFAWAVHSGDVSAPAPIPEPGTMLLMGSGLIGLLAWRRFRRG